MLRRILFKSGLASVGGLVLHKLLIPPAYGRTISPSTPSGEPITLNKTKVVPGSVDKVYQFFTDPETCATTIPNCTAIRNVTRPIKVGSTWEYDYAMAGATFSGNSRCTQYEVNKAFAVRSEGGFPSDWVYTFESVGPNTKVNVSVTYDPPTKLIAKVARKSLLRMHDKQADLALENATVLLEDR